VVQANEVAICMKGPLKCLELAMMSVLNKLTCVAHNIVNVLSVNPLCSPSHFLFFSPSRRLIEPSLSSRLKWNVN